MKIRQKEYILLLSLLLASLPFLDLNAQLTLDPYSIEDTIGLNFDIFSEEYPATITLTFNIKEFQRQKNNEKYFDARLLYHLNDTLDIGKDIKIKARGNNRRDVCSFPPILINIKKANINNTFLQDINKIKLVTHCSDGYKKYNYVILEYLAYK